MNRHASSASETRCPVISPWARLPPGCGLRDHLGRGAMVTRPLARCLQDGGNRHRPMFLNDPPHGHFRFGAMRRLKKLPPKRGANFMPHMPCKSLGRPLTSAGTNHRAVPCRTRKGVANWKQKMGLCFQESPEQFALTLRKSSQCSKSSLV